LGNAQAPEGIESRFWREDLQGAPGVQSCHPCGGLLDYRAGGSLYGLGASPSAQGGGQAALAPERAEFFLPSFAIVDTAAHNDNKRARELCAGLHEGKIAVFDRAYVDFKHLCDLAKRGIFWVTRAKQGMKCRCVKRLIKKREGNILRDDLIVLSGQNTKSHYPEVLRRVRALVEVDGKEREMEFLTNNLEWIASSIVALYKCRWRIEVFFKETKQTLQLCDFLGHNKNAVQWQVWTALLLYVLLRYQAFVHRWQHGFKRFFCLLRSSVWDGIRVESLAKLYGTAGGIPSMRAAVDQLYLPGLKRI
jgi:hypothetical protein